MKWNNLKLLCNIAHSCLCVPEWREFLECLSTRDGSHNEVEIEYAWIRGVFSAINYTTFHGFTPEHHLQKRTEHNHHKRHHESTFDIRFFTMNDQPKISTNHNKSQLAKNTFNNHRYSSTNAIARRGSAKITLDHPWRNCRTIKEERFYQTLDGMA